jgi:hypothetical protein
VSSDKKGGGGPAPTIRAVRGPPARRPGEAWTEIPIRTPQGKEFTGLYDGRYGDAVYWQQDGVWYEGFIDIFLVRPRAGREDALLGQYIDFNVERATHVRAERDAFFPADDSGGLPLAVRPTASIVEEYEFYARRVAEGNGTTWNRARANRLLEELHTRGEHLAVKGVP